MKFRIIETCDPYNARKHYHGEPVVERTGPTPTKWSLGEYDTMDEAKAALWQLAMSFGAAEDSLHYEDEEFVVDLSKSYKADTGEDYYTGWFKGEGVYYVDSHEPMILKGDKSLSYDSESFYIEEYDG